MFRIGCHISTSGGYMAMGRHIEALGGNTFAFFTRNPRGGAAKEIDPADAEAFAAFCREKDIDRLVAHAPYTLNPCAEKENVRQFAFTAMADDLRRMEYTPGQLYNFHPGSHVGQGVEIGIEKTAEVLNAALFPEMTTTVLLETMAGKGSELGGRFEELREIIDRVTLRDRLGVCFDTCHVWDGGYDVVNDLDGVLTEFDRVRPPQQQPERAWLPQGPARENHRGRDASRGRGARHPAPGAQVPAVHSRDPERRRGLRGRNCASTLSPGMREAANPWKQRDSTIRRIPSFVFVERF